ncbi:hypothetical protein H072_10928 [Dactylellina haptotyla CBS 200.50]|uniref:NACHT domain-containing protein n=1 Tax=Dactylellina haptotyla (strain CBS 200.50) TaxID=1284197 RepID=S7ZZ07_DACHA|nr:hypothetical protein H072_10928 [Dactylellina haptotyla CBS 200.50]
MSGAEFIAVTAVIASIIGIVDGISKVVDAAVDAEGLPKVFRRAASKLPTISRILDATRANLDKQDALEVEQSIKSTIDDCAENWQKLKGLFDKVVTNDKTPPLERYYKAVKTLGKGGKVETLMKEILESVQLLASFKILTSANGEELVKTNLDKDNLDKVIADVAGWESSVPDHIFEEGGYNMTVSGSGHAVAQGENFKQIVTKDNSRQIDNHGNYYENVNYQVKNLTIDDINQACLDFLRCPDSFIIKNQLKENKDQLLFKCISWILQDPNFINWNEGDVSLLWIKGGAGKGKTMMAIGLIDQVLSIDSSAVVVYFFCQNDNYELNTLEGILKGLILQLVNQQNTLTQFLRRRWDTTKQGFNGEVTWRKLWDILLEMLHYCKCASVYVIVDALDECQDDGMAEFLRLIVRTGLSPKIKWLVTSRPMDSAEQELLIGSDQDQVLVSLELNSGHISKAVATYISDKVAALDHLNTYGRELHQQIKNELTIKCEDTYLWVSLVCNKLERVHRNEALATIQELPSGLHPLYGRILDQLSLGDPAVVKGCIQLLQVMTLAYRPLNIAEVTSVSGICDDGVSIDKLVDRCASFIKIRGPADIEFIHKSARDYLHGEGGQSVFQGYGLYGHGSVALSCLSYLSEKLKMNIANLPRTDSTPGYMETKTLMTCTEYAATFWVQHLLADKESSLIKDTFGEDGLLLTFLRTWFLEWLECLSILGRLSVAVESLEELTDAIKLHNHLALLMFLQDAIRFLLRYFQTIKLWPLQVYSSAIIFSPQKSVIKKLNLHKTPQWLRSLPQVEDAWSPLIRTLTDFGSNSLIFSPNGKQIASVSYGSVQLWDIATADTETITPDTREICCAAFSPDGKQIALGSRDKTVKLWDIETGKYLKTFTGRSLVIFYVTFSADKKRLVLRPYVYDEAVQLWDIDFGGVEKLADSKKMVHCMAFSTSSKQITLGSFDATVTLLVINLGNRRPVPWGQPVAFSPDGKQIVSAYQGTLKLWDIMTGELLKTFEDDSTYTEAVTFSLNGKQIASGSDQSVKVWDTLTGTLKYTFRGHSDLVITVAFSPDGQQIASRSWDGTIKLWDVRISEDKGSVIPSKGTVILACSPDGKKFASGWIGCTFKLWDGTTGKLQREFVGHSDRVISLAFSPDNNQMISGSDDKTMRLWDATTGKTQTTFTGHSASVLCVAFSPNSDQVISGSGDNTIKLWNARNGKLERTFAGHSDRVYCVAFSPNSQQIASASADKTIKLWDVQTSKLRKTLAGGLDAVFSVAFSPDGKQLASGSNDNTIKLWDISKALKNSWQFTEQITAYFLFRSYQEILVNKCVADMKYSQYGRYLVTDIGPIDIGEFWTIHQWPTGNPSSTIVVYSNPSDTKGTTRTISLDRRQNTDTSSPPRDQSPPVTTNNIQTQTSPPTLITIQIPSPFAKEVTHPPSSSSHIFQISADFETEQPYQGDYYLKLSDTTNALILSNTSSQNTHNLFRFSHTNTHKNETQKTSTSTLQSALDNSLKIILKMVTSIIPADDTHEDASDGRVPFSSRHPFYQLLYERVDLDDSSISKDGKWTIPANFTSDENGRLVFTSPMGSSFNFYAGRTRNESYSIDNGWPYVYVGAVDWVPPNQLTRWTPILEKLVPVS